MAPPSTTVPTAAASGPIGSVTLDSDPLLVAMHEALTHLAGTAAPAVRAAEVSSSCGSSACGGIVGRAVAITLIGIAFASFVFLLLLGRGLKRQLDW